MRRGAEAAKRWRRTRTRTARQWCGMRGATACPPSTTSSLTCSTRRCCIGSTRASAGAAGDIAGADSRCRTRAGRSERSSTGSKRRMRKMLKRFTSSRARPLLQHWLVARRRSGRRASKWATTTSSRLDVPSAPLSHCLLAPSQRVGLTTESDLPLTGLRSRIRWCRTQMPPLQLPLLRLPSCQPRRLHPAASCTQSSESKREATQRTEQTRNSDSWLRLNLRTPMLTLLPSISQRDAHPPRLHCLHPPPLCQFGPRARCNTPRHPSRGLFHPCKSAVHRPSSAHTPRPSRSMCSTTWWAESGATRGARSGGRRKTTWARSRWSGRTRMRCTARRPR